MNEKLVQNIVYYVVGYGFFTGGFLVIGLRGMNTEPFWSFICICVGLWFGYSTTKFINEEEKKKK
jgi:hypothetical protein